MKFFVIIFYILLDLYFVMVGIEKGLGIRGWLCCWLCTATLTVGSNAKVVKIKEWIYSSIKNVGNFIL